LTKYCCWLPTREWSTGGPGAGPVKQQNPTDIHDLFSRIRAELLDLSGQSPDSAKKTARAISLLDDLERMYLRDMTPSPGRGRPKQYRRVLSVRGICLSEHWHGARQPHLVPEEMYHQCVDAVGAFRSPASFGEILARLQKRAPHAPDYALRACLRFWRQLDPPLVEVLRRRYCAKRPDRFPAEAAKAWRQLPEASA